MHPIRLRQWMAVALLVASVASLVWALLQSDRAVRIQGPGALVATADQQVWVGVDEQLWRLTIDGQWIRGDDLKALGLPDAPSTLNRHPGGGIVATVRDDPTLYLLDPARGTVRRTVRPQWPAELARHGGRAINLALHPDGRIAIATGGGHAVALFDADGRFLARTTSELYRFTNGLWWVGDELWTTDTNRTQLKRLDGRTLALQQSVSLDVRPAARYLGPARAHPADAQRVALIRFRNGMTQGRVAVLAGTPPGEPALPQAQSFEPVDVDWLGDDVLASDGASHQLLRIDAATGQPRVFAEGPVRERLARGLAARERHWLYWKLGLAAAGGLLLAGFALAWQAQSLQRKADQAARPIDLAYLGTPRLPRAQQFTLTRRLVGPWLLFFVPLLVLQVFDVRGWLGLDRDAWRWVLVALTPLMLGLIVWLQRRQTRLAEDPVFEPILNAQAVRRLEQGRSLRDALRPDETVLETALWLCPTLRWVVLTDLRLLCFVATLRDHRLEWAHPRAALGPVSFLPRAPSRWSRWVGAGAGGKGWLQVVLPDGRRVEGRITAPTVAQRIVSELQDPGSRLRSAALPVAEPPRAGSGPGPWGAALLSFLVPGLGQWLQRRAAVGLMLFLSWAMFVAFVAWPLLMAAWAPRYEVPTGRVVGVIAVWVVSAAVAAWDAWRLAPRRG